MPVEHQWSWRLIGFSSFCFDGSGLGGGGLLGRILDGFLSVGLVVGFFRRIVVLALGVLLGVLLVEFALRVVLLTVLVGDFFGDFLIVVRLGFGSDLLLLSCRRSFDYYFFLGAMSALYQRRSGVSKLTFTGFLVASFFVVFLINVRFALLVALRFVPVAGQVSRSAQPCHMHWNRVSSVQQDGRRQ